VQATSEQKLRNTGLEIAGQFPAATAGGLHQKDIVGIDVRADRTARAGLADHDIVEQPVGQEIETLKQLGDLWVFLVHVLDEQRLVGPVQRRQGLVDERAVFQRPVEILERPHHQAGSEVVIGGRRGDPLDVQRGRLEPTADQQRGVLPELVEEAARVEPVPLRELERLHVNFASARAMAAALPV